MAAARTAVQGRSATAGPAGRYGMARRAADARGAYAVTMLRGLVRTQQGRPVAQVRKLVKEALTPLGIRLAPPGWQQLAADLAAGRPVTLP